MVDMGIDRYYVQFYRMRLKHIHAHKIVDNNHNKQKIDLQ